MTQKRKIRITPETRGGRRDNQTGRPPGAFKTVSVSFRVHPDYVARLKELKAQDYEVWLKYHEAFNNPTKVEAKFPEGTFKTLDPVVVGEYVLPLDKNVQDAYNALQKALEQLNKK